MSITNQIDYAYCVWYLQVISVKNNLKNFVDLTRLNKPIGFLLLFWPCAFGVLFAQQFSNSFDETIFFLILFFIGSVLMRSAGCIVNDIVDRKIDIKVNRTKNRPIASKKISVKLAVFYSIALCLLAFFILIQFNIFTIILGMSSMTLAFSYPFMKRITYWPQLFLGITFNWGILMAGAAVNNSINLEILLLYLAAIFWTLGYDTIYGLQDIKDDEIIGMKSTSIKFKTNPKLFVSFCYLINVSILILLFKNIDITAYTILVILLYIYTLFYQILIFDKEKPESCLKAFKANNFTGLFLFVFTIVI